MNIKPNETFTTKREKGREEGGETGAAGEQRANEHSKVCQACEIKDSKIPSTYAHKQRESMRVCVRVCLPVL